MVVIFQVISIEPSVTIIDLFPITFQPVISTFHLINVIFSHSILNVQLLSSKLILIVSSSHHLSCLFISKIFFFTFSSNPALVYGLSKSRETSPSCVSTSLVAHPSILFTSPSIAKSSVRKLVPASSSPEILFGKYADD
ncbi:MAG: hypothetical protein ACPHY8_02335 [Patescibacteria group bacterium]